MPLELKPLTTHVASVRTAMTQLMTPLLPVPHKALVIHAEISSLLVPILLDTGAEDSLILQTQCTWLGVPLFAIPAGVRATSIADISRADHFPPTHYAVLTVRLGTVTYSHSVL